MFIGIFFGSSGSLLRKVGAPGRMSQHHDGTLGQSQNNQ
jgi:hypothetical protein